MKIGTVTGVVWSTRKASCLMGQTFLVVQTMQNRDATVPVTNSTLSPLPAPT